MCEHFFAVWFSKVCNSLHKERLVEVEFMTEILRSLSTKITFEEFENKDEFIF